MSTRPVLLYILAPSFSGSTLLTYLLAQHPRVATVGELKATQMGPIDDYRCSCGEPMRTCAFWQALDREAGADGVDFSLEDFGTVFDGTGPHWFAAGATIIVDRTHLRCLQLTHRRHPRVLCKQIGQ